jgi:hypothetical protein
MLPRSRDSENSGWGDSAVLLDGDKMVETVANFYGRHIFQNMTDQIPPES